MITIDIKDGRGSRPKDPYCGIAYDPSIGEIIKYVTEEGDEYFVVTCDQRAGLAPIACEGSYFMKANTTNQLMGRS